VRKQTVLLGFSNGFQLPMALRLRSDPSAHSKHRFVVLGKSRPFHPFTDSPSLADGQVARRTAVPVTWRREAFSSAGSPTGRVVWCPGGLHSPCEGISRSQNADKFCRSGKVVGCLAVLGPFKIVVVSSE
jgi:hypothetical protein